MLARLYVEALLADSILADQVWELWNARLMSAVLGRLFDFNQLEFQPDIHTRLPGLEVVVFTLPIHPERATRRAS